MDVERIMKIRERYKKARAVIRIIAKAVWYVLGSAALYLIVCAVVAGDAGQVTAFGVLYLIVLKVRP